MASAEPADNRLARRRADAASHADYQRRRQTIVRMGAELFHARGLGETSLADVARAADLDRASVYYYFANKEELFTEVIRQSLATLSGDMARIAKMRRSPKEKLMLMIRQQMLAFDQHYPFLFVFVRDDVERLPISADLKRELVAISERNFEMWQAVIAQGMKSGAFATKLPIGITTWTVIGAVAWTHRWYEPGRSLGPEAIADGLSELLIGGLLSRSQDVDIG